jgi:hypothetical protein
MTVSDFRHIYLAGFGLIVAGCTVLLVWEILAVRNSQPSDTITEIVRSYHLPPVVFYVLGAALIGFVVWAIRHFPGEVGI